MQDQNIKPGGITITLNKNKARRLLEVKKEVNFNAYYVDENLEKRQIINLTINDNSKITIIPWEKLEGAWKFLKEQISKATEHWRNIDKKRVDNEFSEKCLTTVSGLKGEQALSVKAKDGSDVNYKKGSEWDDVELYPGANAQKEIEEAQKANQNDAKEEKDIENRETVEKTENEKPVETGEEKVDKTETDE